LAKQLGAPQRKFADKQHGKIDADPGCFFIPRQSRAGALRRMRQVSEPESRSESPGVPGCAGGPALQRCGGGKSGMVGAWI
jgi:hypothetical protein